MNIMEDTSHELDLLILKERELELRKIEENTQCIAETSATLAKIVKDQGKDIDSIDKSLDEIIDYQTYGNKDLYEASEKVANSRYRWAIAGFVGVTTAVTALAVILKRH